MTEQNINAEEIQKKLKKFKVFGFEGFEYAFISETAVLEVKLNYNLDGAEKFSEVLGFPITSEQWNNVDIAALERALEGLLIMGGISYYKTYCPAEMDMGKIKLNAEQSAFWKKIYERGLGEFFYQNNLDWRGLINFPISDTENKAGEWNEKKLSERSLLPIGGGKDSIVSGEILRMAGEEFSTFSLRDAEPIRLTAEVMGKPRVIVQRKLSQRLIELNAEGALNGHVPITAYISFVMVIAALIYDHKYLVLSLEKSANFGQVMFHGMDVNHQYSKSEEFEGDFRKYIQTYISGEVEYFSLLRVYYEVKIAQIFAGLKNFSTYAPLFTSCNNNFKIIKKEGAPIVKWCGECPKCLFVFIILAAFVKREDLLKIFGSNLLDKKELSALWEETLGIANIKPFECVGTFEESQLAMQIISEKSEWQNDFLVKKFVNEFLPSNNIDWAAREKDLLGWQEFSFIPKKFLNILPK